MKTIITLFLVFTLSFSYAQDSNILISLGAPSYGIRIKNNFPSGTGGFARAFMLSNQDASKDFIGLGAYGVYSNGISTLSYGYIGPSYNETFMVFKPNGNVGIGTTSPAEKLSVKGKIRSQEIKVENANWPDFVFNKDYELPSLRETEKRIKEMGHLPGIPSATEVKANGLDLGEMNAKLLQKIEELTLHLIRQNEQIIDQQKAEQAQQVQISQLKKVIGDQQNQMDAIKKNVQRLKMGID